MKNVLLFIVFTGSLSIFVRDQGSYEGFKVFQAEKATALQQNYATATGEERKLVAVKLTALAVKVDENAPKV